MDLRTKLDIIYSDGGSETDFSQDAQDFKRDTFNITLTTDDFIYVGFKKTINALYFALEQVNTITSSLSIEFFSDEGWSQLEISDDTRAFSRSGFITWLRPLNGELVTIAGKELCWIRISSNDNIDLVEFQAINLVFSDDNDICSEVPALVDTCFYQQGASSHILQHVAAKNYIMSRLKTVGYINFTETGEQNINEWDILDVYELRQASTYYAISQIYFNLSDNVEDQYWSKYKEYEQKFEEAFSLGRLRIDMNDDGQVNSDEKRPIQTVRWSR